MGATAVISNLIERLRAQHKVDLKLYRSGHRDRRNHLLHWLLIPVECWSALLFLWILTGLFALITITVEALEHSDDKNGSGAISCCHIIWLIPRAITGVLGILSLLIATNTTIGVASLLFHIFRIKMCVSLMQQRDLWVVSMIAGLSWSAAWIIQGCVGHVIFERNLPNIANPSDEVSYLAMSQSVLIAWSS